MSTSQVSISLNDETIKKLDSLRGLTKRSTLIESIVSEFLNKKDLVTSQATKTTSQGSTRKNLK